VICWAMLKVGIVKTTAISRPRMMVAPKVFINIFFPS
jgi:hypothetical protein